MENKDIHNGLDKKEIRDFLAKSRAKEGNSCSYMKLDTIQIMEKQIIKLQEYIQHIKNLDAIETLIKINDWKNFDVSDDVTKYNPETYFEFLGTEEEFKELINKINEGNNYELK